MKAHEQLVERFKAMIKGTPHGAIIVISDKTGGSADLEYASNLTTENQLRVLGHLIERIKARAATS